jgi:hypothetical protein
MAATAAQIVTLACQEARCPGYTSQAGQLLNAILQDLCQDFDFELARKTYYFNFNPSLVSLVGPAIYGGGPYPLPSDYLRAAGTRPLTYWITGTPYMPIKIDIDQFDMQVQQAGNQSYPSLFTTDLSLGDETAQGGSTPQLFVFEPPSGSFSAQIRYFAQMPDITTPETSSTIPWFPNSRYLRKKLTADLMGLTGDDRAQAYHGEAEAILSRYLIMKDDPEGSSKRVKLDRRSFGSQSMRNLPNTKTVGW